MLYIVMEVDWEYDDNYYTRRNGGQPVVAYKDKEIASMECIERNIDYFKNNIIATGMYGGSLAEYLGYEELEDIDETGKLRECLDKYGVSHDKDDWEIFLKFRKQLTDDQIEEILSHLSLRWYEVVEIPDNISAKVYKRLNKK